MPWTTWTTTATEMSASTIATAPCMYTVRNWRRLANTSFTRGSVGAKSVNTTEMSASATSSIRAMASWRLRSFLVRRSRVGVLACDDCVCFAVRPISVSTRVAPSSFALEKEAAIALFAASRKVAPRSGDTFRNAAAAALALFASGEERRI